ncbi:hypothetical protein TNCV_1040481 [Trichonephila clavipes]|nr:hypothetical protein TNCV_1040481 [Trichonephila clavipes]
MGSVISRQMQDGIKKWGIDNPRDPDQDNGTKLLNYCTVTGPGHVQWLSDSVSRFHTTGPGSIPGLGKVDSALLQWVDK